MATLATGGFRHGVVTPDDHSDLLDIEAIFLMVSMILAVGVRLTIRFTTTHRPGMDDVAVVFAMVRGTSWVGFRNALAD
jgi:hypothetical protein